MEKRYREIINTQRGKIPDWKIFEYEAAIHMNMILWEDVDFEKLKVPHKADYGIDLINPEFTKTAQVKHYGKNSTITWRSVSTYIAYSSAILKIQDMTLVTTKDAKIPKIVEMAIPKIIRMGEIKPISRTSYVGWIKSWFW